MKTITASICAAAFIFSMNGFAHSHEKGKAGHKMMEMTAEKHEKMAKAHQEAADCMKNAKDDTAKMECRKKFKENFGGMKKGMKKNMKNKGN